MASSGIRDTDFEDQEYMFANDLGKIDDLTLKSTYDLCLRKYAQEQLINKVMRNLLKYRFLHLRSRSLI
jgi:hypothetical protein